MSRIDWCKELGWNDEQIEDLRYAGYAYLRQGKYEIAISFFEALAVLDPESAYDAQTLGALYLQLGNTSKAYIWLEKALKVEADHGPTLLNFCKLLFMVGKKDEGLKLANILKNESNMVISNTAKALILAYG